MRGQGALGGGSGQSTSGPRGARSVTSFDIPIFVSKRLKSPRLKARPRENVPALPVLSPKLIKKSDVGVESPARLLRTIGQRQASGEAIPIALSPSGRMLSMEWIGRVVALCTLGDQRRLGLPKGD